jgi:hypothetical protein
MVVALDLKRDRVSIADVDETRIFLPGADEKPATASGQFLELGDGILVTAVFAPHYAEYAKFGIVGLPSEYSHDLAILIFRQSVLDR